ncbi:hypothetical protein Anapl_16719 [Anas platyrhynchos]|uniref:Uncharacterized protein n=1 Tax=Anas platyrhynchos TaxID=8839 RepID=R0L3J8_ANAPL|nr:hypothetical protein Anapl_16719 [Anas platyrhynchos]
MAAPNAWPGWPCCSKMACLASLCTKSTGFLHSSRIHKAHTTTEHSNSDTISEKQFKPAIVSQVSKLRYWGNGVRAASAQPGYNKECATLRAVAVPAQVELETSVTNKAIKERCASVQAIASSFLQLFCYTTLSVCHPHLHGYHYILTTVIAWNPSTVRFANNNRFAYYVGYSIKEWQVPQVKEGTVLLNLLEFLQQEAMSRLSTSLTSTETEENGKSQAMGRRNSRPKPSAFEWKSYEAPNAFIFVFPKKRINKGKVQKEEALLLELAPFTMELRGCLETEKVEIAFAVSFTFKALKAAEMCPQMTKSSTKTIRDPWGTSCFPVRARGDSHHVILGKPMGYREPSGRG